MRLDKFLKVSRIIKRRTVAKEVADKERIFINQKVAKSSSLVKVGDELTIEFGTKTLKVRIDKIVDTTKKDEASQMYTVLEEVYKEKESLF
ncbi:MULTISPECIES: RNA-binding S4 domain-containing protein [unclassified Granulicatella]|uniref:RNA-binding S4 domain-containing protein n=1 Tax=unclassified Granulicatella TaxID=2630493 RepID=UPI001072F40C|nr:MULTISPECIES: RNA-binding S4 domain-containing protein [unclassified Granulicatella]MBF0780291.1 RNA-binding S4 domain-containing protein [Granulicatella sp. 19428wC4_WM01]TFU95584.1 RNA-binding S4 domain-containing protein [Granulicatella sp. WM01]